MPESPTATALPVLYGIASCDACRKARAWLRARGVDHRFHDLRADGLDAGRLDRWLAQLPWETLLNRRGTTWRALDAAARDAVVDRDAARAAMLAAPLLVKRPVLELRHADATRVLVGFGADDLEAEFARIPTAGPETV